MSLRHRLLGMKTEKQNHLVEGIESAYSEEVAPWNQCCHLLSVKIYKTWLVILSQVLHAEWRIFDLVLMLINDTFDMGKSFFSKHQIQMST